MKVSQLLICADGVHIGINAVSRFDVVIGQSQSFPFGQRVYHFGLRISQIFDRERNRSLYSVQIIVDSHPFQYEERSCDTAKA